MNGKYLLSNVCKNYVSALLLSGSVILGGCSKQEATQPIPLSRDTQLVLQTTRSKQIQFMDSLKTAYNNNLDLPLQIFDEAVRDGYFSEKEQKEVYSIINKSRDDKINIQKYAESIESCLDDGSVKIQDEPKSTQQLYTLLKGNLEEFDWGTPEMEKKFYADGQYIKVEPVTSPSDALAVGGIVFGIGVLGIICAPKRSYNPM